MKPDFKNLSIHTITNKPWSVERCIEAYAAAGIGGITLWRYNFEGRDPAVVGRQIREAGLVCTGLARGGFFPALTTAGRQAAVDENKRALDEAAACGAPVLVLVCGAVPGQALEESRRQVTEGIAACLEHARAAGVKLAIEPLHPMYADDRSAIVRTGQANDVCEALGSPAEVGIALDVYHTWWDAALEQEIKRAGAAGRLLAYHVCDWRTPTEDLLNDRGLMGEGCIPLRRIKGWMEAAGFEGFDECEIFSTRRWAQDQDDYLASIKAAWREHC
jgi:sugar phosphate isomerase/epimerase